MMKFELESLSIRWCKRESGVMQSCPLPPLLFNMYTRELDKVINNCVHGIKYAVVAKEGSLEWKRQAGKHRGLT